MAPSTQVRLNALRKTQSAISTQMVSHGNVWLLFSRTLRSLFGGIRQNMLWAWWDRYDSVERLHKSKQVLACHSHIRFWTASAYDFFLRRRWDTFFRERKATKSNVLGSILLVPFFLWLVVRYSFASCQNVATQHHPAGLSMLDLWSGAVHDLQSE